MDHNVHACADHCDDTRSNNIYGFMRWFHEAHPGVTLPKWQWKFALAYFYTEEFFRGQTGVAIMQVVFAKPKHGVGKTLVASLINEFEGREVLVEGDNLHQPHWAE